MYSNIYYIGSNRHKINFKKMLKLQEEKIMANTNNTTKDNKKKESIIPSAGFYYDPANVGKCTSSQRLLIGDDIVTAYLVEVPARTMQLLPGKGNLRKIIASSIVMTTGIMLSDVNGTARYELEYGDVIVYASRKFCNLSKKVQGISIAYEIARTYLTYDQFNRQPSSYSDAILPSYAAVEEGVFRFFATTQFRIGTVFAVLRKLNRIDMREQKKFCRRVRADLKKIANGEVNELCDSDQNIIAGLTASVA